MQGRNISSEGRGGWASYAAAVRRRTGLGKTDFGKRLNVDRGTIHRWETGQTRPGDPAILERFAATFALPLDEVLAAAGLRPDVAPPSAPANEPDPEIEEIIRSGLSERIKKELIEHVMLQRARDEERRIEDLRRMIRLAGGKAS